MVFIPAGVDAVFVGDITINADGSISPSGAPLKKCGKTYSLTDDLNGGIHVYCSDIILKGKGYVIDGSGSGYGINLAQVKGCTVKGMDIDDVSYGIYLDQGGGHKIYHNTIDDSTYGIMLRYSNDNKLKHNDVSGCSREGIRLWYSSGNCLKKNIMTGNGHNFEIHGFATATYDNDVDRTNTVDGKPIIYWQNKKFRWIPSNAGMVVLVNCRFMFGCNMDLRSNSHGIILVETSNSMFTNIDITDCFNCIYILHSKENIISRTSVSDAVVGIILEQSEKNIIRKCSITMCGDGMHVFANDNLILSNEFILNDFGVFMFGSIDGQDNNFLKGNLISENVYGMGMIDAILNSIVWNDIRDNVYGFWMLDATDNIFHHNNIIDNIFPFDNMWGGTSETANTWDDSNGEGNHWSDYAGEDSDDDGVGDTNLPHNGVDYYPMMNEC
jgi:parallel beta-helix repeat protein